MNTNRHMKLAIPKPFKENYKALVLGLFCSICITLNNILRETEVKIPSLALHIPSYIVCFVISYTYLRFYYIIKEQEPQQWETITNGSCIWRIALAALLMASSHTFRFLARNYVSTTENTWSLDIWTAHIPFWVAVLSGTLQAENLFYSMGTSLSMTCALVLMLPVDFISRSIMSHVYANCHVICVAGVLILLHQILNSLDKSTNKFLTPFHVVLHLSTLVPLFLLLIVGFVGNKGLPEFIEQPLWHTFRLAILNGIMLFMGTLFLVMLFQGEPIFFGTMAYCIATCFAILTTSNAIALFGMCLVFMSAGTHTYFVYTNVVVAPYRDLKMEDFSMMQ